MNRQNEALGIESLPLNRSFQSDFVARSSTLPFVSFPSLSILFFLALCFQWCSHVHCVRYISSLFWIIIIAFISFGVLRFTRYLLSVSSISSHLPRNNFALGRWITAEILTQTHTQIDIARQWQRERERLKRSSRLAVPTNIYTKDRWTCQTNEMV